MRPIVVVAVLLLGTATAKADFIVDSDPGGTKFFIATENKDTNSFSGTVDKNIVNVSTTGNVDTGSGFATIKPIKDGSLTTLVFTPANGSLFNDFSFRGQLLSTADGTVTLTVQDNQNDAPQTFTFTGLGSNADFALMGIVAKAGSGETIQSITLTSEFKEEKQNEFSYADPAPVPLPGTFTMSAMLALVGVFHRRRLAAA